MILVILGIWCLFWVVCVNLVLSKLCEIWGWYKTVFLRIWVSGLIFLGLGCDFLDFGDIWGLILFFCLLGFGI